MTWTVDILAVKPTSVGNDEVERFWIIERFRISKDFCSVINHDQKWILYLNGIKRIAGTFMKEHQWDILETTKNSIHKLWCNDICQHVCISTYQSSWSFLRNHKSVKSFKYRSLLEVYWFDMDSFYSTFYCLFPQSSGLSVLRLWIKVSSTIDMLQYEKFKIFFGKCLHPTFLWYQARRKVAWALQHYFT